MRRADHLTLVLFTLINGLLISLVVLFVLREPFAEWKGLNAARRLQETRLTLKERNLDRQEENQSKLAALEQITSDDLITPFPQAMEKLSRVSDMAQACNVRETTYEISEPLVYETGEAGERNLFEIKAATVYEGSYTAVCDFFKALTENETGYRFSRLSVEPGGAGYPARIRIDFSVYAEDIGVPAGEAS